MPRLVRGGGGWIIRGLLLYRIPSILPKRKGTGREEKKEKKKKKKKKRKKGARKITESFIKREE